MTCKVDGQPIADYLSENQRKYITNEDVKALPLDAIKAQAVSLIGILAELKLGVARWQVPCAFSAARASLFDAHEKVKAAMRNLIRYKEYFDGLDQKAEQKNQASEDWAQGRNSKSRAIRACDIPASLAKPCADYLQGSETSDFTLAISIYYCQRP